MSVTINFSKNTSAFLSGDKLLGDYSLKCAGKLGAHKGLLVWLENVYNTVD